MRQLKVFPTLFLLLLFASPSFAVDEDTLKQKIEDKFSKLLSECEIQEPSPGIPTRSLMGSRLYRTVANGVVLVMTANDVIGSGVVVSSSGLIITNWHVVENEPVVGLLLKQTVRGDKAVLRKGDVVFAKILKSDPVRDLALLKIVPPSRDLTVLKLGTFSQVEVGQDVFAVSHPQGLLWSYTEGVISQIRPDYNFKSESGTTHRATYIQTQTVISQGSSGGALFDYNGQLIGILVATIGPGLNFAVAINEVQSFIISALEKQ